jgi:two-component system, chemotaxis family, protein-glutamate methylesterase/glutaminase
LLSGMGKDGAEELRVLRDYGAVTIAQDKESSVVHGMPGEAIKRDAATYVLPPEGIAEALKHVVHNRSRRDPRGYPL